MGRILLKLHYLWLALLAAIVLWPVSSPALTIVRWGGEAPPPVPEDQVGPLEEDFRAFVITSQEELDEFQARSRIRISRGTTTSLGKIDFPNSILVAGYLMWRPVQGDPLSVVGFNFEPGKGGAAGLAEVRLELEDSPQGRERPYLLAPMAMVALNRTIFSHGEQVDFVFQLNGETVATVTAAITATGE